jgi:hypothetical protein
VKNLTEEKNSEADKKIVEKAAAATEQGLMQRIESVIHDVLEQKLGKAFDVRVDKMIEEKLKAKEIEVEAGLRKGFGLENDPVIHQSDLVAALRKAALDQTESQKRTPAPTEKGGPEGNMPEDEFDKAVKEKMRKLN